MNEAQTAKRPPMQILGHFLEIIPGIPAHGDKPEEPATLSLTLSCEASPIPVKCTAWITRDNALALSSALEAYAQRICPPKPIAHQITST